MAAVLAPVLAVVAGAPGRAGVDADVAASDLGEAQGQSVDLASER